MVRKNSRVMVREEEEGHFLLFNPDISLALILNTSSYEIWKLCDGQRETEQIQTQLESQYDMEASGLTPHGLKQVIEDHLGRLQRASLIEEVA